MEATVKRITAEKFLELAARGTFKTRFVELVDGVVVVDQPRLIHGVLQARIVAALQVWTDTQWGRGLVSTPVDVVIGKDNAYGPDVLWIAERHRPVDPQLRLERIPDLCVEIRSPSTWPYDIGEKKRLYEAGRLPELWLVDNVAERVYVFRRSEPGVDHFDVALELGGEDVLESPQLPGFALPLERLFRR